MKPSLIRSRGLYALTFLLLMVSFVSAEINYTHTGGFEEVFQNGIGFFNSDLTQDEVTYVTKGIASPRWQPLVSDVDNDNIQEILVFDGNALAIFNSRSLVSEGSFIVHTDAGVPPGFSPMHIQDLDDDGLEEIIIMRWSAGTLDVIGFNWNGTDESTKFNHPLYRPSPSTQSEDGMVSCDPDNNHCLAVLQSFGTNSLALDGTSFNETAGIDNSTFATRNSVSGGSVCLPWLKTMPVQDYDNDGQREFMFSIFDDQKSTGLSRIQIFHVVVNASGMISEKNFTRNGDHSFSSSTNPDRCTVSTGADFGSYLTSPLVDDLQVANPGMETSYGFMLDTDNFKVFTLDSDGDLIDDFPELVEAEGILVSNVMKAKIHGDSDGKDFCVLGLDEAENEAELLCGSVETGNVPETKRFILDLSDQTYNITPTRYTWNHMIHAGSMTRDTVISEGDSYDPSELIFSYGVSELSYGTTCDLTGLCFMDIIFQNPKGDAVLYSVDAERTEREDLLIYTASNFWYADDGFSNSVCATTDCIGVVEYNPCILTDTAQVNTTLQVSVPVFDIDNDLTASRVIVYADEANELDSGWSANVSSGTKVTHAFTLNQTTGLSTIKIMGRDSFNPDSVQTETVSFSVSESGVVFGQCSSSSDFGGDPSALPDEISEELADLTPFFGGSITDGVDVLVGFSGLAKGFIWFIFMTIVGVSIWMESSRRNRDHQQTFWFIVGIQILLIIIGRGLDFVSTGAIVVLGIMLGLPIVYLIASQLFGARQGG